MSKIEGLEEVLDRVDSLADTSGYESAIARACALVEAAAKKNAPKGSGELRRSITSKVVESDGEILGIVFTPLEYAPYVEFGTGLFAEGQGRSDVPWCYKDDKGEWHTTSGMKPQPFMRPALNDNREQIIRMLKEGLNND